MSDIIIGDNGALQKPTWDTACFDAFVTELADEVTGSCMIPMNLPRKEVNNIVKRAKKWFYKNYEYSVRENFMVLPIGLFSSDHFKKTRSLTLPSMQLTGELAGGGEVWSVYGLGETGSKWGGTTDVNFTQGDFAVERMMAGGSNGTGAAVGAENLQYYVINQSFFDLARQIIDNPLSYDYSQLTHELKFTGESPSRDVILEVYETIPECALFDDEIFFRYCAAKIKISLGQKLAIFGYTLPGNISINPDVIKDMGVEELDKVIEEIKSDEGTDWMMHS